ncbi:hypothetical protein [Catenuloplanes japonicus]|uniref:hypothetical protein n=1 Tax=Catenuloplanes japonicus TaxID=33876 RepID=UPI00052454EB|nr:hypothetical protein [Catenuloplanes japonicus]
METSRASYGETLLVSIGWYATVLAGLAAGDATTPDRPRGPDDCTTIGSCLSLLDLLPLLTVVAGGGLLLLSLPVAAIARLVTRSAVVAGTLTAGGTALTAWTVITVLAASR